MRNLPLCARADVKLPVEPGVTWDLVGDFGRLPELTKAVSRTEPTPHGYRVFAGGGVSVARIEESRADSALVGVYTESSMLGFKLPSPELDGFWVALAAVDGGTKVEFGRAFSFRGRLAQSAGRALVPAHQKILDEMAASSLRILAPSSTLDVGPLAPPNLLLEAESDTSPALTDSDARKLQERKLRAHKVAAMAAGFGMASQDPANRRLGQAGLKATIWHAERTVRKRYDGMITDESWPETLERLSGALSHRLGNEVEQPVLDDLIAGCRLLGMRDREDLIAGLGLARFGIAVGELEAATYRRSQAKQLRKFIEALDRSSGRAGARDVAKGAAAVATDRAIGRATLNPSDLGGFSMYVRDVLVDVAGASVSRSPDLEAGLPPSAQQRAHQLFDMGWAVHIIRNFSAA